MEIPLSFRPTHDSQTSTPMIGPRNCSALALSTDRILLTLMLILISFSSPSAAAGFRLRNPAPHAATSASGHAAAGVVLPPRPGETPHVSIPAIASIPVLSDFLPETPTSPVVRSMLHINNFVERYPEDGAPATEPTAAYLGSTHEHLYVAFVCKDRNTQAIRAHMLKRDSLSEDDFVQIMLDTFHDKIGRASCRERV